MPALTAGGLYKTNRTYALRFCRGLSVPRSSGRRGHGFSQIGPLPSLRTDLARANLEARGGIEPPIKVLQTFALPLGDRASDANLFYLTVDRA